MHEEKVNSWRNTCFFSSRIQTLEVAQYFLQMNTVSANMGTWVF